MAAEQDVKITMSADTAKALKAWQAMQKGPAKFGEELEKTGKKGRRASQSMGTELTKLALKYAAFTQVISLARQMIVETAQAQKQLQEEFLVTNLKLDAAYTKFYKQGGLTGNLIKDVKRREEIEKAMPGIAASAGYSSSVPALAAGTALMSQGGFSAKELIEGGALQELLKSFVATNAPQEKAGELAGAMGGFIAAMKMPLNRESVERLGVTLSALFQKRPLEMSQLEQFGRKSGIASVIGHQIPEQYLASLATIMPTLKQEEASTQLGNIFITSGTLDKTRKQALEKMGLDPDKLDFSGEGEDIQDFVRRHLIARAKHGDKAHNAMLKEVFGRGQVPALLALFSEKGQEVMKRNLEAVAEGRKGRNEAVRLQLESLSSTAAQLDLEKESFTRTPEGKALAERALTAKAVQNLIDEREARDPSWLRRKIPGLTRILEGVGLDEDRARSLAVALLESTGDRILKAIQLNRHISTGFRNWREEDSGLFIQPMDADEAVREYRGRVDATRVGLEPGAVGSSIGQEVPAVRVIIVDESRDGIAAEADASVPGDSD